MNDEGELEALTNSEWSAVGEEDCHIMWRQFIWYLSPVGCTPKATVDHLEREFLKAIVSLPKFDYPEPIPPLMGGMNYPPPPPPPPKKKKKKKKKIPEAMTIASHGGEGGKVVSMRA